MMKFFKGLLSSMSIGITVGLLISIFFSSIFQLKEIQPSSNEYMARFSSPIVALTVAIVIWAFMGAVFYLASFIFMTDRFSITRKTVYHFLLTYCGYTGLAIAAGWFPYTPLWLVFYTVIFVLIYLVMWYLFMKSARHLVAEVNKATLG